MNTTTVSSAKQNLENLIRQVESDAEPVLIRLDEESKAVLMSGCEFNSWQETIYLLSNPDNAAHLRKSFIKRAAKGDWEKSREILAKSPNLEAEDYDKL